MTPHQQHPNDPQHPDSTQRPNDARHPEGTHRSKDFLAPREVAALLRVGPKTISHWARKGHLEAVYTPGGHRRFHTTEVQAFLQRLESR